MSTRKATPRSKNGCLNCKKRKLKCGEEKPICKRCAHSGSTDCIQGKNVTLKTTSGGSFHTFSIHDTLPSSGVGKSRNSLKQVHHVRNMEAGEVLVPVQHDLTWSQGTQVSPSIYPEDLARLLLKRTREIPFQVPGSENERRLFQYFRSEAIPDIGGYSNFNFWNRSILSWGHEEPVLRYAMVALASFHECRRSNIKGASMSADQNPASLRHYNKAIRAVQKLVLASSKKSRQMILTCCLLFYAIEGIRGGFETGVKHLKSGLAILNESTAGSNSKMNAASVPDVDEDIAGLLSSLDIVYSYMNNFSTPSLVLTTVNEQIGKKRVVPMVFSNTRQVQTVCTKLTNWAYHFVLAMIEDGSKTYEQLPALMQQELRSLLLSHEQVEQAFTPLRNWYISQATTQRTHLRGSLNSIALGISFLGSRIAVDNRLAGLISYPPSNDLEYYLNEILSLVETLIKIYKLNSQGPERLEPRSFFQIRGVISSTMLVTLTAREASTRTRGLQVMREWPNAAGTPEEIYDGKRIALAIEAAGMDNPNSENKDVPYGKYRSIPQFRDTMDEVVSSLQRRSFLWVGEVGDFGLGGLATLFGYYEDSAVQLEFIDPEAPPSGPISILAPK